MRSILFWFFVGCLFITGCATDRQLDKHPLSDSHYSKVATKQDPQIILDILRKHKIELAQIVREGQLAAEAQVREEHYRQQLSNRLEPSIAEDRLMLGNPQAPITIVSYSDFLCPYCAQAAATIHTLMEKYPDKIRFVFKHHPLDQLATKTAIYFEAAALQSSEKAWQFHDYLFAHQQEIVDRGTTKFIEIAQSLELDLERLKQDAADNDIIRLVAKDIQESERFGFEGTPAFVINGIGTQGALPLKDFEKIIEIVESNRASN